MAVPTTHKRNSKFLISTDQCPRCVHLISQHDDSPPRCNGIAPGYSAGQPGGRCSCVLQDVIDARPVA